MKFNDDSHKFVIFANRVIGPVFAIGGFSVAAYFLAAEALPIVREAAVRGVDHEFGLVTAKVLVPMVFGWLGVQLMKVKRLGLNHKRDEG